MQVILGLTFAGAALFSTVTARRVDAARREAASLAAERMALEQSVTELGPRLRESRAAAAGSGAVNLVPADLEYPASEKSSNRPVSGAPVRSLGIGADSANDSVRIEQYLSDYRASLDLTHGGMAKALDLAKTPWEEFKDMEVEIERRRLAVLVAAGARGHEVSTEVLQTLEAESEQYRSRRETEILGARGPACREFFRIQAVRELALDLAWASILGENPLTAAQVERTTRILAAHDGRLGDGPQRGTVDSNGIDWGAASGELPEVLSPEQIRWLGIFVERDRTRAKVMEREAGLSARFLQLGLRR